MNTLEDSSLLSSFTLGYFPEKGEKPLREMLMLLNDLAKKTKEKQAVDWDAYCKWNIMHHGSLWADDASAPVVWKCSCGAVSSSVAGEKYGTCQHCGLIFLAFPK